MKTSKEVALRLRPERAGVRGLPFLAVVAVAILILEVALLRDLPWAPQFMALGKVAGVLLASGAFVVATWRLRGRERRPYAFGSASLLMAVAGQVGYVVELELLGRDLAPWGDAVSAIAMLLGVGALLTFPVKGDDGPAGSAWGTRLRMVLDGLIAGCALLFVSWATVLGAVWRVTDVPFPFNVTAIFFPTGHVAIVTLALVMLALLERGVEQLGNRAALGWTAAGLAVLAVADSGRSYTGLLGADEVGLVLDGVWIFAFALLTLGGWCAATTAGASRGPAETCVPVRVDATDDGEPVGGTTGRVAQTLPYLPAVVSLVVAAVVQIRVGVLDAFLLWNGFAVVALVFARQLLALRDNAALTAALELQANTDSLTGLPNRRRFRERLRTALHPRGLVDVESGEVAVLLVDLDGFKGVNDSLGHAAGDRLLVAVAERLRRCVRAGDVVARLGGDEFAVLVESVKDASSATGRTCPLTTAERIVEVLGAPVEIAGTAVTTGASIGVAATADGPPAGGEVVDCDALLRRADTAMYAAKRAGRNRVRVFEESLRAEADGRAQLEADLRRAVRDEEFSLVYQPIVNLTTDAVTAVEALLRWRHPERGLLAPAQFLHAVEELGLMTEIGRWVLHRACADAQGWQNLTGNTADPLPLSGGRDEVRPGAGIGVHVNVSATQLAVPGLVQDVRAALTAAGLDPALLTVELTEHAVIRDTNAASRTLQALRALGVTVALDDFGVGHSSLAHLHSLPVDVVKIDRSFVAALTDASDDTVTAAVLSLVAALGLRPVAEGVERPEQTARLRALACPEAQGYHFARPVELGLLHTLLLERTGRAAPAAALA